jgi:hypothetical protein
MLGLEPHRANMYFPPFSQDYVFCLETIIDLTKRNTVFSGGKTEDAPIAFSLFVFSQYHRL